MLQVLRNLEVPTGNILIVQGEKGKLEMLSIGDYGKDVNLKCDAMGLNRELTPVKHTDMLPLSKKWVITISTQYGCSMGCRFCDVPKVGPGINATTDDLVNQVLTGLSMHPEVKGGERLNIHFARMGEPTFNPNVITAARKLRDEYKLERDSLDLCDAFKTIHPVVSTMMPVKNNHLEEFIRAWMQIKNDVYEGEAGLQLSINSTDDQERTDMFGGSALRLNDIKLIMKYISVVGRKITLNFAVAGWKIDPGVLLRHFSPDKYIIKLTPMHKTVAALEHGIETEGDYTSYYPYKEIEQDLKSAGYDVLVFIASEYEDLGRITCGNAILSGTTPEVPFKEIAL